MNDAQVKSISKVIEKITKAQAMVSDQASDLDKATNLETWRQTKRLQDSENRHHCQLTQQILLVGTSINDLEDTLTDSLAEARLDLAQGDSETQKKLSLLLENQGSQQKIME
ncbi:MAG: hypothetical protein M1821_004453 [Bathelium mastoideum]|nr:MAG: hypothetical protein M1821_004453 [Bathelium mastoideum]